jgi:hypothetical protein
MPRSLSSPSERQLCRTESLHPPGHPVITTVLQATKKRDDLCDLHKSSGGLTLTVKAQNFHY